VNTVVNTFVNTVVNAFVNTVVNTFVNTVVNTAVNTFVITVVNIIIIMVLRHRLPKLCNEKRRNESGSSVSIVSGYGLDDWAIEVRSPAEAKDFSSNLCVQTGSGADPASCTMGTGGPFPGG
jgi:hypothetical protein